MDSKYEALASIKDSLHNAPREVKDSYNSVVTYLSWISFDSFLCEMNLLSPKEILNLTGLRITCVSVVNPEENFVDKFKEANPENFDKLVNWFVATYQTADPLQRIFKSYKLKIQNLVERQGYEG